MGVSTGGDTWGVWKHNTHLLQVYSVLTSGYQERLLILSCKMCVEHVCECRCLPLGVLAVNSGSKQNVSSGLPAAGLNGGWSSLLNSFCREDRHTHTWRKHTYMLEIKPYHRLFGVCEHMLKRSQDPSQINPLLSLYSSVPPMKSCWPLNTHAEPLVLTQWELALCPEAHIQT